MTEKELTEKVKRAALDNGACLVGVVRVEALPEHSDRIERMLPGARSVLVVAAKHSIGSLRSGVNELGQFDTIHTYNECAGAAHAAARLLESQGCPAAAVPAFIPLRISMLSTNRRGPDG